MPSGDRINSDTQSNAVGSSNLTATLNGTGSRPPTRASTTRFPVAPTIAPSPATSRLNTTASRSGKATRLHPAPSAAPVASGHVVPANASAPVVLTLVAPAPAVPRHVASSPVVPEPVAATENVKGGRKRAENKVLRKHFKQKGPMPKIHISPRLKRPLGDWCQEYINEMGIICRKHLPLAKENWKEVDAVDKETIYKHILDCFDMDLSQTHVKECLSKRGNAPDWVNQDAWEVLYDRFESEKFQRNPEINEEPSRIDLYPIAYFSMEKGWSCPQAQENYERMVELQSQQPQGEGSIALTDDEIADQVSGIKSGYVRGLGYGVVPPSSRLSGSIAWRLTIIGGGQWMLNLQFKDCKCNKNKRLMTCVKNWMHIEKRCNNKGFC